MFSGKAGVVAQLYIMLTWNKVPASLFQPIRHGVTDCFRMLFGGIVHSLVLRLRRARFRIYRVHSLRVEFENV